MNARRVAVIVAVFWAASACLAPPPGDPRETPSYFGEALRREIAGGTIERAVELVGRALTAHPRDPAMLAWAALVEQMQWQDVRALAYLMRLRDVRTRRSGAAPPAELLGQIGDVLFRSGSYADSVSFLQDGHTGEDARRREALVGLTRELPYSRYVPQRIADELPLIDGSLPVMLCTIGDRQRPFVLDTGASLTTLTRSLADELGVVAVREAGTARDGTGREIPVAFGVLHSLSLGSVELDAQPVLVVEESALGLRDRFGAQPAARPNGVVGLDILSRFRVTFDPDRRSVLFELPSGLDLPGVVRTVRHDGRCLVPTMIEGRRLWFVLDTGASHSSLTDEGLRALPGHQQRARVAHRRIRSPGGASVSVREVRGLGLEISAVRFDGVTLPVVPRGETGLFPVHGVLGADLVMRCRTTFDGGDLLIEAL